MDPNLKRNLKAGILSGLIVGIVWSLVGSAFLYFSMLGFQSGTGPFFGEETNIEKEISPLLLGSLIQLPLICIFVSFFVAILSYYLKVGLNYKKIFVFYFILFFFVLVLPSLLNIFPATSYSGYNLPPNYSGPNMGVVFFYALFQGVLLVLLISLLGSTLFYIFLRKFGLEKTEENKGSEVEEFEEKYGLK